MQGVIGGERVGCGCGREEELVWDIAILELFAGTYQLENVEERVAEHNVGNEYRFASGIQLVEGKAGRVARYRKRQVL